MAIKKIPCGGFYYDDETVQFEDGVIKAQNKVITRKIRYDVQSDNYYWDDERSFLDTINYCKAHPDTILVLYYVTSGRPIILIPSIKGSSSKPSLLITDNPSFNYTNNMLIINTSQHYIYATESQAYSHKYELTDLTVNDVHN